MILMFILPRYRVLYVSIQSKLPTFFLPDSFEIVLFERGRLRVKHSIRTVVSLLSNFLFLYVEYEQPVVHRSINPELTAIQTQKQ